MNTFYHNGNKKYSILLARKENNTFYLFFVFAYRSIKITIRFLQALTVSFYFVSVFFIK